MDASRSLFCGIQRKAHGAQQPRHIGENVSTTQRSDEHAKWIYGGIL